MTIYMDVVFLINLLYQLGIIKILSLLFRVKCSNRRLLTGAAMGSAIYCITIVMGVPYNFPWNILWGTGIGGLSIFAAFYPMERKKIWEVVCAQFVLAFCLNGVMNLLPDKSQNDYLMITAVGAIVFLCLFSISVRNAIFKKLHKEHCIREIRLIHKGKAVEGRGLIDTGNGLKDPISAEAVILISKDMAEALFDLDTLHKQEGYRVIPYESIGVNKGILEAFRLEQLEIKNNTDDKKEAEFLIRAQILCAVHKENLNNCEYEVILHPLLL